MGMIVLKTFIWLSAIASWALFAYCLGIYLHDKTVKRWIRGNCKVNIPAEMTVILPGVDWGKLRAWVKLNSHLDEIRAVVAFAKTRGRDCSLFIGPDFAEVERIMADKNVREVCFVGHGGAHFFRLNTTDLLPYCVFADREKYGKDFVHQIHCGTQYGKRLIDYVVPEANRAQCFFATGEINGNFIEAELKRLGNLV